MKNLPAISILSVIALGAVLIILFQSKGEISGKELDYFAKCLADKGAVMYGADWCPHCQNEKKAFGDSFRFISYVECPNEPNLCLQKQVQGYPTWIFGDGNRFEGEQGLERLSKLSGCSLPAEVEIP